MAYDSSCVLAVLHNGHPVREINGKISLPFHSEYKIRLKNKHNNLRAKACVWVDGRKVSILGNFILHPGETLDLERFLDDSMVSGNRFKFVPLSDSRVNDPTDSENGIIKVEFYREVGWKIDIKPHPVDDSWMHRKYGPQDPWIPLDSNYPYSPTIGSKGLSGGTTTCCYTSNAITSDSFNVSDNAGATVEGSVSGQKFVRGADFLTETFPITLTLKLKGISNYDRQPTIDVTESKQRKKIRFCSNCGRKRRRLVDKFCWGCGERYVRKRPIT